MNLKKQAAILPAIALFFAFAIAACTPQKDLSQYMLFQHSRDSLATTLKETLIQPNDLLSIQVLSKSINQEQTALFNLFNVGVSSATNTGGENSGGGGGGAIGYQVSTAGTIEVPLIGEVKAAGLTKNQLESSLEQRLASYVKDPMVNVRFLMYNVSILGEVRNPGIKGFPTDRVTIVDALTAAGDLTDVARRDNVQVIREQNGQRKHYIVNLSNSRALFASPVYQLQPNDIVYVSPSQNKLKNMAVDPDAARRRGLILSAVGLAATITNLIIRLNQ
ncbi:MAG TPA: polysaccharide biosynthesis/export family protein [Flavisolibacter sp.]|jgi:polysaccharide export outer membrane protein|nr:polysaccharide biosynthesis/export family protein [Flavisolibacter sp.]